MCFELNLAPEQPDFAGVIRLCGLEFERLRESVKWALTNDYFWKGVAFAAGQQAFNALLSELQPLLHEVVTHVQNWLHDLSLLF
ncbi:MAG: hypothetical protein ACLQJR_05445 [Stellaceae bacterium]